MRAGVSQAPWLLVLVHCMLLGCGGPSIKFPDTVPVTGKVTLDGQPLPNATVVFTPSSPKDASALGYTDASGNYELETGYGAERHKGAPPGEYKVHISTMLPPPPKKGETPVGPAATPAGGADKVPDQYSSLARTKLTATIDSKGGTKDFDLKSK